VASSIVRLYRKDREDLKGLADLIVAKQRSGADRTGPRRFLSQFTRFENRAEDLPKKCACVVTPNPSRFSRRPRPAPLVFLAAGDRLVLTIWAPTEYLIATVAHLVGGV